MHRVWQALASFWAPLMLVTLIFSTMIEGTRTGIEHTEIAGYLLRWFLVISPAVVFFFLAERSAPPASPGHH